uniref:Neur_chan_LBD domain-containing protein n=1 Tax=Steinernema glaseri TaxID=37863 RepID=A0A1I7ZTV0_9BILA
MQTDRTRGVRSCLSWRMSLQLFQLLNILTLPSQGEQNNEISTVSKTLVELNKNLFKGYDSSVPSSDGNPIIVSSLILIQHIQALDQKQETLKFHADLTMSWIDPRLSWNPSDYNNVQEINVFKHLHNTIWWPHLLIRGVVTSSRKVVDYHNTEAILRHEGLVITTSSITVESKCNMDYTKFPDDVATCVFYMGAPLYSAKTFRFSEEQMIYGNDLFHSNDTAKGTGDFRMVGGDAYVFYMSLSGITRNYTAFVSYNTNHLFLFFRGAKQCVHPVLRAVRSPTATKPNALLPEHVAADLCAQSVRGAIRLCLIFPRFSFASATVAQSHASIIWLFCCLVLQVINATIMIKGLPPNYDTTPLCAKVAMVSMVESCFLLVYRIVMNHLYKATQGRPKEQRLVQRVELGVTVALCLHLVLNFWLILY